MSNKIIIILSITIIIVGTLFFPILPRILNYPPDSINNEFEKNLVGLTYNQQFLGIIIVCYIVGVSVIKKKTRKLDNLKDLNFSEYDENNEKIINKIFSLQYNIFLVQIIVPFISVLGIYTIIEKTVSISTVKIALLLASMETLIALVVFIYCKNLIAKILKNLNINKKYIKKYESMKKEIFIIISPMILVALIFTSLLGYSRIIEEKSMYMYMANKILLERNFSSNKDYSLSEVNLIMDNIDAIKPEDEKFIIYEDKTYKTINNKKLSDFFIKYTIEKSETQDNRTYDSYGEENQGAIIPIFIDGQKAYVGIMFNIIDSKTILYFFVAILLLLGVNCVVLYYICSSLANDTKRVADAINLMVKNEKEYKTSYLPITSNDEFAQLVISFNEVQDLTSQYISTIESNQYVMQRQAQFAILGEFAGGLAHDLNSPLSAVQLDISTLKKYMLSDKISADSQVKNVVVEMLSNIDSSLEKMAETISGVRNQIRSSGDTEKEEFNLKEVIDGVEILFSSLLRKNNCKLENLVIPELTIFGEKNKMDRVIGNLVKNSLDAYVENGIRGNIVISANIKDNKCLISIEDKAGGIPDNISQTLFKEMKTTKKEKGTGFGLYYCNTIIESSFNGTMYFDTVQNDGTIFYIEIPMIKEVK